MTDTTQQLFAKEVAAGERFEFGRNWQGFLKHLDERRIQLAQESLRQMLGDIGLSGRTFLDAGCGSGLFSLAARRMGARVHSFDYDPQSVACAQILKNRYFREDPLWTIEQASVLDTDHLAKLGHPDIVYSWGVLHHTGAMWSAIDNVARLVRPGGLLYISIYNDQGWISNYWKFMKRSYNHGILKRCLVIALHFPYLMVLVPLVQFTKGKLRLRRGMSRWHDVLDWLGGLPFEVARPAEILEFLAARGLDGVKLKTCGRKHGCNEYVAQKRLT
ncbi:MAG: class I SAM-dependent methyltransferase [Gammaproteobacteria bacterium]|nr:class I SAM-dependent methyltransferase [Gammaproteobacteria bacterium]MDE2344827.1 class I SAM-dependent methyltransferase [Gammaproteobacteria bacterium]